MAPFDRLYTTFYWSASTNIALVPFLSYLIVMYTVLSSLAACGCLGVAAAAAGVFVCHA